MQEIKNYLGGLGIAGEFTYPTPMQSVDELVELALGKHYTTIVAIGGDEIVNAVCAKLLGRKEALGIIPLESSPDLRHIIGVSNWREACEALRFRKIIEVRLGQTAAKNIFLTNIFLNIKAPLEVTLEFKDYLVQARLKNLLVANYSHGVKKIADDFLDIVAESVDPKQSYLLTRLGSAFGLSNKTENTFSLFRARSLRIFTKTPIPLVSHQTVLAKTPQLIESSDEYIRLITAKKAMTFWGSK